MEKVKNVFIFISGITIIFIVSEIYFNITGISLPSYVYDNESIGRTHKPGQKIFEANAEGFCIDEVNAFGYTGNGYPKNKSEDVIRIALFGSSYIEGLQVFRRNRFSTILENNLKTKLQKNIEVLNFAIGGDDFRGMFLRYKKLAQDYKPDLSLFFLQNQALVKEKTIPSPQVVIENDTLKFNYRYLESEETELRKKFQFVRFTSLGNLFKEGFEAYYSGRLPKIVFDKLWHSVGNNLSYEDSVDKYGDLNTMIFNYLNEINNSSGETKNIIIFIDSVNSYYYDYLQKNKFPYFNLYEKLKPFGKEKLHFWKASNKIGHWNNFAHRLVGNLLTDYLSNYLMNENYDLLKRGKNKYVIDN